MMKQLIYITGVSGGILLILRVVGIYVEFAYNDQLLSYGAALVIVCLTLGTIYKYIQNQKIRKLLRNYRDGGSPDSVVRKFDRSQRYEGEKMEQGNGDNDNDEKKGKSGEKGLEPGKNSLRERKTGLVWGGGNIKGANATRGTKRKFIKRW